MVFEARRKGGHRRKIGAFGVSCGSNRSNRKKRETRRTTFETSSMEGKRGRTPSTMATVDVAVENEENDYSKDGLDLVNTDPMLEQHKGHLQYRWEKFREVKKAIENASGSLSEFADGYKEYGFSKKKMGRSCIKNGCRRAITQLWSAILTVGTEKRRRCKETRLGIGRVSYRQGRFRTIRE